MLATLVVGHSALARKGLTRERNKRLGRNFEDILKEKARRLTINRWKSTLVRGVTSQNTANFHLDSLILNEMRVLKDSSWCLEVYMPALSVTGRN